MGLLAIENGDDVPDTVMLDVIIYRDDARRRLEFAVSTALVMVRLSEKSSRKWKLLSTLSTTAPSAERTRTWKLNIFYLDLCICSVKRQATGIWKCIRCKKTMAGGAYVLR